MDTTTTKTRQRRKRDCRTELASRLRKARAAGHLTDEHEAEIAAMKEKELGSLEEADAPPDPLDPFAEEA